MTEEIESNLKNPEEKNISKSESKDLDKLIKNATSNDNTVEKKKKKKKKKEEIN